MSFPIIQYLEGVQDNRAKLALTRLFSQFMSAFLTPVREVSNDAAPASITTAGNATYTAAQLLTKMIARDPNGAGRTDTLDTAANIVGAMRDAQVGDRIVCEVINGADAAETITLAAGAGGTFDAALTAASRVIPQNSAKTVTIRITNITPGAEAYVVYA
jgi:hypothetical protein